MTVLGFVGFFVVFTVMEVQSTKLLTTPSIPQVGKRNVEHNAPLILFIDAGDNHRDILKVIDTDDYELTDEDVNNPEEDAKLMFYKYLRTSPEDDRYPEIKQQKEVLRTALRKRCENVLRCKRECESSEDKDKYCPVNCQDVFDKIMMCDPPKKKKDPCEKEKKKCVGNGKTLPPRWKFK